MNPASTIKYILMSISNLNNLQTSDYDKVLIFDIDDTLYKHNPSLRQEDTDIWINKYKELKLVTSDIPEFGDNLGQLIKENDQLKSFIKRVTYEAEDSKEDSLYSKYLSENVSLRDSLNSLPYKKFCFTNAPKRRAERVLNILGVTECFEGIFHPGQYDSIEKPKDNSYEFIEKYLNITDPSKIYFYDDLIDNIEPAKRRGWNVIHVKDNDDISEIIKNFN